MTVDAAGHRAGRVEAGNGCLTLLIDGDAADRRMRARLGSYWLVAKVNAALLGLLFYQVHKPPRHILSLEGGAHVEHDLIALESSALLDLLPDGVGQRFLGEIARVVDAVFWKEVLVFGVEKSRAGREADGSGDELGCLHTGQVCPHPVGCALPVARLEGRDGGGSEDVAVGACREDGRLGLDDECLVAAAVEHRSADDTSVGRQKVDEHGVVHDRHAAVFGLVHESVHHGPSGRSAIGVRTRVVARLQGEVPYVSVRGGAVQSDIPVVLALEIDAPLHEFLDTLHGLIDKYLCEFLVGEESAEGDEVTHRGHVCIAVLSVEAYYGAGADVQGAAAVSVLALDDHGHAGAVISRLYGGPQARASASNDEYVGRYGLVHLKSAPVVPKF